MEKSVNMKKQRTKGERASFLLGLPVTLLAIIGGIVFVVNGFVNLGSDRVGEGVGKIIGGVCMAILGFLHFRSGVLMVICGFHLALGGVISLVVLSLEGIISSGGIDPVGIVALFCCLVVGVLEFIGGIVAVRNVRKMRKASPWIEDHKKPVDFLKEGLTQSETIIEADYSKSFYDENNLNTFKVIFPDATVLYRQQAVLRIANRLFVAGNDISGNTDPELIFFFEVITEGDGEKLVPIVSGTEEQPLLTDKYYKLIGHVAPATIQSEETSPDIESVDINAQIQTQDGLSQDTNAKIQIQENSSQKISAHDQTQDRIPQKTRKIIMIIIFALYAVTLILGILTATTGMLDSALSSTVEGATKEVGRAYGVIMGLVWVTTLPSVGYYIAFASPVKANKRGKFFIVAGSVILSIILDIVFFAVTKNYRPLLDSNDKWFIPFTVVAGSVCSLVCYLLTVMRTDALSLKEIGGKSVKDSNGLLEVLRAVFVGILNFLLKATTFILRFKDVFTDVYALIAAILFTLLLPFTTFVVSFIIIALAICTLVLKFAGFVHFAYEDPAYGYDSKGNRMYSVYENGSERILTYNSYDTFSSRDVYIDDIGNYWYTLDNGETFQKE